MATGTEKIESASAALGAANDKEEAKAKVSNLLSKIDKKDDDMDVDDKGLKEDEGLLGTEIAEEIEKSLGPSEMAVLREMKKLQVQHFFINKKYEDDLQRIKFRYEKMYQPLYARRKEILISGLPNLTLQNADTVKKQSGTPYLPGFWLSCLKRHRSLEELIEDQDEAILEYLIDIRCEFLHKKDGKYDPIEDVCEEDKELSDSSSSAPLEGKIQDVLSSSSSSSNYESFRLIFEFIDNPYLSPNILHKEYHLNAERRDEKKDEKTEEDAKKEAEEKKDEEKKEDEKKDEDKKEDKKDDEEKKDEDKKDEEKKDDEENARNILFKDAATLKELLNNPDITDDKMNKNLLILSEGTSAELERTVSTPIQWKEGKDPTQKVIVKKQRNRRTKQTRTIQETVLNDSFFNFFSNHVIPREQQLQQMSQRQAAELQMVVEADYDIGVLIRDRIIPEAVTWFLGLAIESEEDLDDDEDDDDDNDDEDDYREDSDDDSEEDAPPKSKSKRR